MSEHVEVVTRYGGHRHLARAEEGLREEVGRRYFTLCHGTSAWDLESWARFPDHPQSLTVEEMAQLPVCSDCEALTRPKSEFAVQRSPLGRRLTIEAAREHIGSGVVYVPAHGPREDGVITSVGSGPAGMVFVRYGADTGSKATRPGDLELLSGGAS